MPEKERFLYLKTACHPMNTYKYLVSEIINKMWNGLILVQVRSICLGQEELSPASVSLGLEGVKQVFSFISVFFIVIKLPPKSTEHVCFSWQAN